MGKQRLDVVRTTKGRLCDALDDHKLTITDICRKMGRSQSGLCMQLQRWGGISTEIAEFLETTYGIWREEYELRSAPKMELCPSCYYSVLRTEFVRKISWLDHELTCDRCGRHGYGGTYEVLRREGTA